MKERDIRELYEKSPAFNKRGITFIKHRQKYRDSTTEVSILIFFLDHCRLIIHEGNIQFTAPEYDDTYGINVVNVKDIIEIHFPSQVELDKIFGEYGKVVPEDWDQQRDGAGYYWAFVNYLREDRKKIEEVIAERFFHKE
jgi:hypothetical protein